MTTIALQLYIDRRYLLAMGQLRVPVVVVDTRTVFGRVDCLVEPIGGSGCEWVSVGRLHESY